MSNTTTETAIDRAEQQAIAQVDSIVELVRRLDRETSAEDYYNNADKQKLVAEWVEHAGDDSDANDGDLIVDAIRRGEFRPSDYDFDQDSEDAINEIMDGPLEITYRTGWLNHSEVCDGIDKGNIEECCILLCTGGPAVRILCDVSEGTLSRPRVQYQDWGTPWTELLSLTDEQRAALNTYISSFEIQ